jgi:hypothetical protein
LPKKGGFIMLGYPAYGTGFGLGAGFGAGLGAGARGADCICSLPLLVVLILIILQFSRHKSGCHDGGRCGDQIGNGILFIIALFFLACVGCPKGFAGRPAGLLGSGCGC